MAEEALKKEISFEQRKKMDDILNDLKKQLKELEDLKAELKKQKKKPVSPEKTRAMLEEIKVPALELIK